MDCTHHPTTLLQVHDWRRVSGRSDALTAVSTSGSQRELGRGIQRQHTASARMGAQHVIASGGTREEAAARLHRLPWRFGGRSSYAVEGGEVLGPSIGQRGEGRICV